MIVNAIRLHALIIVAILCTSGLVGTALAQAPVTQADIQRLEDGVYDASRDIAQLRDRDSNLAARLQEELDELRDEVVYLRVKLRKNEPVARTEYSDVRDRIERVRTRARGDVERSTPRPGTTPSTSAPADRSSSDSDVPAGTEIDVRLQRALSSGTAQPEDVFEATTVVDLRQDNRVLIPAGSLVRGVVRAVNKAGRLDRKGSLDLAFDQITVSGRSYPIRATVTQAIESEGIKGEVEKIGVGAGLGAIIGGILGGFKGVLAGIAIGGGGVIAATEGEDVNLPSGTVLRIRLDSGLNLR